jgi:hypothetical protein
MTMSLFNFSARIRKCFCVVNLEHINQPEQHFQGRPHVQAQVPPVVVDFMQPIEYFFNRPAQGGASWRHGALHPFER